MNPESLIAGSESRGPDPESRAPGAGDVARLLIRAPNPLGDAIMSLPAMAAVRATLGDRTLIVAAAPAVAPLFEEITAVAPQRVITLDEGREAAQLREVGADAILLLTNSFRTAWVSRQARISRRLGYRAHGRSLLLTQTIRKPRLHVHQSEYYLHLVRELGFALQPDGVASNDRGSHSNDTGSSENVAPAPSGPGGSSIHITPETRQRVDVFLKMLGVDRSAPLVGFAPGAAYGHAKRWPPDRVAQVIARLGARGVTCVVVGAGGDRDAGREIESALPAGSRVVNVIGRTDLRLLTGVLASCHAFVSNDSGAMHLAAAVGVPVAAIFGPTNERVTAPLGDHDVIIHQVFCRPCMLRDCPIDHRCMRRVSVDTVFDTVIRRLDQRLPPESRA
jgi:lipopolysaccharide heptosyltransferase II